MAGESQNQAVSRPLARCFGSLTTDSSLSLSQEEAHHLSRVLRVRVGQKVEVVAEQRLFLAEVSNVHRSSVDLEVLEELPPQDFGSIPIHLFAAMLHRPALERMVRLATELHVTEITLLVTERCQNGELRSSHQERLQKIAFEACKQARRVQIPSLSKPRPLQSLLPEISSSQALKLVLTPRDATLKATDLMRKEQEPSEVWLFQGPEGGWSDSELGQMTQAGAIGLNLGRAVLRAENCPLVALTLIHHRFGKLLTPW